MRYGLIGLTLVFCAGAAPDSVPAKDPAEAIRLADTMPGHGVKGRYKMIVVSSQYTSHATFLNSTDDYKRDDDLTFALKPSVAGRLKERYGAPPEEYLKGKRVTVDGVVERHIIVNTINGQTRSVNRVQHTVDVTSLDQIVAIENAS